MRETICNKQFDEERSLYYLQHADVENCIFAGPADGESVLKEARDVSAAFPCGIRCGMCKNSAWKTAPWTKRPGQPFGMPVTDGSKILPWVALKQSGSAGIWN